MEVWMGVDGSANQAHMSGIFYLYTPYCTIIKKAQTFKIGWVMTGMGYYGHWSLVTPIMLSENLVNIGSGNGLVPGGTMPLPEPMLTYHQ